jgi:hypothetical protein
VDTVTEKYRHILHEVTDAQIWRKVSELTERIPE